MDASNFPGLQAGDTFRIRLLRGVSAVFGAGPKVPAVSREPRPVFVVSIHHMLFLMAMMVLVIPAAFALDPIAGALRGQWPPMLSGVAGFTTGWGKAQWVLIPAGVLVLSAFLLHRWTSTGRPWLPSLPVRVAAFMFASTGTAEILSSLLKGLFGRARPQLMDTAGLFSVSPISFDAPYLSFPSGHASAVGATCMSIALLWPRTRWVMLPVGLWLGFTRVFVGAHYPSDVIVGLVLGAYIAVVMAMLFERHRLLAFPVWRRAAPIAPTPL